ncbi:MAG: CPBP family intramembrane metalloprotease [Clostridiales bacterium]|nr:CPBP family intramembrane metalloprotease [Clostridiales bacterium]
MNFKEKLLRKERSWTDILLLVFIQAYLWMQLGGFLGQMVFHIDKWGYLFTSNADIAADIGTYLLSLGFCYSIPLGLLVFKKNRKLLKVLSPEKKTAIVSGSVLGLASGFALNAAIVAGAVLTGSLTFTSGSVQILPLIGYLIAILFQAGGEELICRMFIMGKLRRRYKSPVVAIVGNCLFFTIFHLGNPGITAASILGVFAAGIMFSLIVYYSENIWIAIGMHTAWNFTQTILFGLPNSGMSAPYSVFKAEKATSGLCFDAGFGVEGSWAAVIAIGLVITAILLISRKRGAQSSLSADVRKETCVAELSQAEGC